MPHHFVDYANSILDKFNVKWESKSHPCNLKSHEESQKAIENSKNHEDIPTIAREVNLHPIVYIYTVMEHTKGKFTLVAPTRY